MMKEKMSFMKRWIVAVLYVLIGVTLIVCNLLGLVDSFWSGMGTGLAVVGALQIFRLIRYKTDPAYQEQVDTAQNDERNRFLGMKAWSWAGYLYVLISGASIFLFKALGNDTLMFAASGSLCLVVLLYWVAYIILRKKH